MQHVDFMQHVDRIRFRLKPKGEAVVMLLNSDKHGQIKVATEPSRFPVFPEKR